MKRISLFALLALLVSSAPGCYVVAGAFTTVIEFSRFWVTTPLIPVSPYYSQMVEDAMHEEERYGKVPILDAVEGENAPLYCLDPPTPDEVIRALDKSKKGAGGFAFIAETSLNNVRMVIEPIVDKVDECRFIPLVGPARLHHCHYKCTLYFDKTTRSDWPIPHTFTDQSVEVLYIDHDHYIRCTSLEGQ